MQPAVNPAALAQGGTLIEAWASQKSFQRKDRPAPPSDDPGNPKVDFHGEKRSNETHQSTTDPDARLARKSGGHESKLAYCGNVLIEKLRVKPTVQFVHHRPAMLLMEPQPLLRCQAGLRAAASLRYTSPSLSNT